MEMKNIYPTHRFVYALIIFISIMIICTSNATAQNTAQNKELIEEPDPWYQVELIVFEYTNTRNAETEIWPQQPGIPDNEWALELMDGKTMLAPAIMPVAFQLLDQEEFQLTNEYKSIKSSRQRRPLLHVAWRQPTTSKKDSIPIRIHGGKRYTIQQKPNDTSVFSGHEETENFMGDLLTQETYEPSEENAGISPDTLEQIEGTITLSLARYLHIWADFIYRLPSEKIISSSLNDDSLNSFEQPITNFRLQQHRRMRSKEIHYLDHPLLGIIVMTTPYELPDFPVENPASEEPGKGMEETPATNPEKISRIKL